MIDWMSVGLLTLNWLQILQKINQSFILETTFIKIVEDFMALTKYVLILFVWGFSYQLHADDFHERLVAEYELGEERIREFLSQEGVVNVNDFEKRLEDLRRENGERLIDFVSKERSLFNDNELSTVVKEGEGRIADFLSQEGVVDVVDFGGRLGTLRNDEMQRLIDFVLQEERAAGLNDFKEQLEDVRKRMQKRVAPLFNRSARRRKGIVRTVVEKMTGKEVKRLTKEDARRMTELVVDSFVFKAGRRRIKELLFEAGVDIELEPKTESLRFSYEIEEETKGCLY